jgi:hypothetical protein
LHAAVVLNWLPRYLGKLILVLRLGVWVVRICKMAVLIYCIIVILKKCHPMPMFCGHRSFHSIVLCLSEHL